MDSGTVHKMDTLFDFTQRAQANVTGEVTLDLGKGNIAISNRRSPNSLYDDAIATMEGGGDYNQTDSEGFTENSGPACAGPVPVAGQQHIKGRTS